MKKVIALLSLFSLTLPLFSSWYSSNQLGQKKGELDSFSSLGWVLYEEDERTVLYNDGKEKWRKEYSSNGWVEKREDETESVFLSPEGRIERRVIESDGERKEYNYFYSSSLLSGYNYSLNGTMVEKVEYTTTKNGDLLYYTVLDKGVYLSDNYFVTEDGERIELDSTEGKRESERRTTESGGYIEKSGGVEVEYDASGRLIREEDEKGKTTYTYLEAGVLSEKREERDDGVYVTHYSGETETVVYYNSEGEKVKESRTLESGEIEETRYISGEARYVFIYDRDGKRIKEAYAL